MDINSYHQSLLHRYSLQIRLYLVCLITNFVGQPSSINVVAVKIGKITARNGDLILGRLGFQLRHTSLGPVNQPPGETLDVGLQPNMVAENVMQPG